MRKDEKTLMANVYINSSGEPACESTVSHKNSRCLLFRCLDLMETISKAAHGG